MGEMTIRHPQVLDVRLPFCGADSFETYGGGILVVVEGDADIAAISKTGSDLIFGPFGCLWRIVISPMILRDGQRLGEEHTSSLSVTVRVNKIQYEIVLHIMWEGFLHLPSAIALLRDISQIIRAA
jgi:hypothetical protein